MLALDGDHAVSCLSQPFVLGRKEEDRQRNRQKRHLRQRNPEEDLRSVTAHGHFSKLSFPY